MLQAQECFAWIPDKRISNDRTFLPRTFLYVPCRGIIPVSSAARYKPPMYPCGASDVILPMLHELGYVYNEDFCWPDFPLVGGYFCVQLHKSHSPANGCRHKGGYLSARCFYHEPYWPDGRWQVPRNKGSSLVVFSIGFTSFHILIC